MSTYTTRSGVELSSEQIPAEMTHPPAPKLILIPDLAGSLNCSDKAICLIADHLRIHYHLSQHDKHFNPPPPQAGGLHMSIRYTKCFPDVPTVL